MKRFYKTASINRDDDGFGVLLDGRPVRTPARALLQVTSLPLAEAISEEWNAQGDKIEPLSMPLTQLTNTAIDRMPDLRDKTITELLRYAETDLVCYRADHPQSLVDRQNKQWQPLLDWLRQRYDIALLTVVGVLPQPQNPAALKQLRRILNAYNDFELTALHMGSVSAGSVVVGLAMMENRITAEEAADAAHLDDTHQIEMWGADEEAEARLAQSRADIEVAYRFQRLLKDEAQRP